MPIVSRRNFLFTTASYGYGIAVDTFDGHTALRHSGGMLSLVSTINHGLDAGAGGLRQSRQRYRTAESHAPNSGFCNKLLKGRIPPHWL